VKEGTIKPSFAKGTARRLNFISQEKSFRRLRAVVDSQRLLVAREKPQLKREMINIQQERGKGDLQGLSHKLRRSLNKGLKQFCITSGSSVIKHTTKLKGEEGGTEKGKTEGDSTSGTCEFETRRVNDRVRESERGGEGRNCLL